MALNAAVETLRAGEHGRGSAIVAAEACGLAQESAKAAHEIKQIASDSANRMEACARLAARAASDVEAQRLLSLMEVFEINPVAAAVA